MLIPIGVTAKNEAANILQLLSSLRRSVAFAESLLNVRYEIIVILNDNSDHTPELLSHEVVWTSTGGIVEAQRILAEKRRDSNFVIFSDADILISQNAIYEISKAFIENPKLSISYVEKIPLQPQRKTLLAQSLYLYNLNNGYQSKRHYLNGQLFGIRNWNIPRASRLQWVASKNSSFLNLEAGIRCDDIFLSRQCLSEQGPQGIQLVDGHILYRPPETLTGMFRKYQRMTLEIERLNIFFPDSILTHSQYGKRRFVFAELKQRPLREKLFYVLFVAALYLCKSIYWIQKKYYSNLAKTPYETWKPILETKRKIT